MKFKINRRATLVIILLTAIIAMVPIAVSAETIGTPQIKKITTSGRQITITYGKVKNAKTYVVYKVTTNSNGKKTYKKVATSTKTTIRCMGKHNTKYDFVVKAFNGKKSSKLSKIKSVKVGRSYTYAVFGSDSRNGGEGWKKVGDNNVNNNYGTNGSPRSDMIMLLKLNYSKDSNGRDCLYVDAVSVYRDTLVNINTNGGQNLEKVNRAYAKYGPAGAVKVLEQNLDISIDGYIAVNFKGVADAIDEMGGVRKQIENIQLEKGWQKEKGYKYVTDLMNVCIDEYNRIYGESAQHVDNSYMLKAKVLSGPQAVAYARVRYTKDGDIRRAKRQRDILTKIILQFNNKSLTERIRILKKVYPSIDTNISYSQMATLLKLNGKTKARYNLRKGIGYAFYKRAGYMKLAEEQQTRKGVTEKTTGREFVLLPTNTQKNVIELHRKLYGEDVYKPGKRVSNNNTIIQNDSKTKIYNKENYGLNIKKEYRQYNKNHAWNKKYDTIRVNSKERVYN